MTTGPTAVIAGAGIGGLAAAIGLRRIGMDVRVVEQRPEPGAIGAGIALFPNAVRAFDALGVGDVVRAVAGRPFDSRHESGLRLPSGRWLVRTRPQQDEPLLACHRNDLHAALLAAVPPGVVEPATSVVGVRSWSDGVDVTLRTTAPDGGTRDQVVRADLLVGADGIGSVVRSWMWPEASARYAGYTAWRAVTAPGDWPAQGGETWGRGMRFGVVPITGGRVYWFATANLPEGSGAGLTAPQRHAEVAERFAGWHDPIPQLVAATRPDDVLQHDIGRLDPPLPSFVRGRVALLGDAAHAMTPDLGQGACQAVEDAAVLAAELARTTGAGARGDLEGGVAAALAAYDGARRPRTQRVARTASQVGRFAQLDGRVSTAVRAGVMWLLPSAAFGGGGGGWLLDWHPPAVPRAVTAPRAVESPTAADAADPAEASGGG